MKSTKDVIFIIDKWQDIFKKYDIRKNDIVIVSNGNCEVVTTVSRYLCHIIDNGKIFFFSFNTYDDEILSKRTSVPYTFIVLDKDIIDGLDLLPSTHFIFDNMFRCSFNGEDVNGYDLVGFNGIGIEDIVAYGVLRLGRTPRENEKDGYRINKIINVNNTDSDYYKIFDVFREEIKKIINEGQERYRKYILNEDVEEIFLSPLPGSGDVFLLSLYLRQYIKTRKIKSFVLYVTKLNLMNIAALMGIRAKYISSTDMKSICIWRRCFNVNDNAKILDQNIYQKQTNYLQAIPRLDYSTMLSRLIFDGINADKNRSFKVLSSDDSVLKLADKKTILLVPFSNTINEIEIDFWERISKTLNSIGFKVLVNVTLEQSNPIKGADAIYLPYEILQQFCDKCFCVIGVRNGIFDIISNVDCLLIIIYTGKLFNSNNGTMQFFSLKSMGLRDEKLLEIEYKINDDEIENIILNYLKKVG